MELSAYPRHRKRSLNGFRSSFRLFPARSGSTNAVLPRLVNRSIAEEPAKVATLPRSPQTANSGILHDLANEICQEAGGTLFSQSTLGSNFGAAVALALNKRRLGSVVTWPQSEPQSEAREEKTYLSVVSPASRFVQEQQQEHHFDGGRIQTNGLKKIVEICSIAGDRITFQYSSAGELHAFTRFSPAGAVVSNGVDSDGRVVVKDASGRVLLNGEGMSLTASGCLTIGEGPGQTLSIDLLRAVYTERKLVESESGSRFALTAMFALDGFRTVTCFQPLLNNGNGGRAEESSQEQVFMRFYGRDGSMLSFDSEENLKSFSPSQIEPPGSKLVKSVFVEESPAHTAWDAVHAMACADWDYFHRFVAED